MITAPSKNIVTIYIPWLMDDLLNYYLRNKCLINSIFPSSFVSFSDINPQNSQQIHYRLLHVCYNLDIKCLISSINS